MKKRVRTLIYIALCDESSNIGVANKIKGTVRAAQDLGYTAHSCLIAGGNIRSHMEMAYMIAWSKAQIVMLRSPSYAGLLAMGAMIIARLRMRTIIVEVPTPHTTVLRELILCNQSFGIKVIKVLSMILAGPWALWPASRIIQCAEEGSWYSLGNRSRTVKIGNGIDVDSIPMRQVFPQWPAESLRLIGVAKVTFWHGYDRVIRAIAKVLKDPKQKFDIHFTIVGDGPEITALKQLTAILKVQNNIDFTGQLNKNQLRFYYESSHLAVGSLGLYRTGLKEASGLKAREYLSVGIPFIAAGSDPDFDGNESFRICVSNDESEVSIVELFSNLETLHLSDPTICRKFAEQNLDFRRKLSKMLGAENGIDRPQD